MGKIFSVSVTFFLAFSILAISVLRSASVKYVFSQSPSASSEANQKVEVEYEMVYPGRVAPDGFLWPLKVFRDKIWLAITVDKAKKAEIMLLLADKRLIFARELFQRQKPELAVTTLTKAEKYLESAVSQEREAFEKGENTEELLNRLAKAALKHREIIEDIMDIAPEDAKPAIVQSLNYPKRLFEQTKTSLGEVGREIPDNPFDLE